MGKASRVLTGIIAGGLMEMGKSYAEMTLQEAKNKFEIEKEKRMAEFEDKRAQRDNAFTVARDEKSQAHSRGIVNDQLAQAERLHTSGQEFTAGQNQLNREHQTTLTREQIAAADSRQARSDALALERDANRTKSEEARDTFVDKDGFVRVKASGALKTDPETGQPLRGSSFANGGEREQLAGRIAAVKQEVDAAQKAVAEARTMRSKDLPKLEEELRKAREKQQELLGMSPASRPAPARNPGAKGTADYSNLW
jgi:hypothetical protein